MYDIIGDIHGYADELVELLETMGYKDENGVFRHPSRKVIFVGDLIDRGPHVRQVIQIAKRMVEEAGSEAILGNHEMNVLTYYLSDGKGRYLRSHSEKHTSQLLATLSSFHSNRKEWDETFEWLLNRPLFFEKDGLRVIHAAWSDYHINIIKQHIPDGKLNRQLLLQAFAQKGDLLKAMRIVLKGFEVQLPPHALQPLPDGRYRHEIRLQWWRKLQNETYRSASVHELSTVCNLPLPNSLLDGLVPYPADAPPVFFGHYWFSGAPALLSHNVCCVDYSIAKGHMLTAYQWNGEQTLSNDKYISVYSHFAPNNAEFDDFGSDT